MSYKTLVVLLLGAIIISILPAHSAQATSVGNILNPGDELALVVFDSGIGSVDWSPDGELIALTLTLGSKLVLVNPSGTVIATYSLPVGGGPVEWRPGSDLIAVGSGTRLIMMSSTGVKTLDKDMGKYINSIAWSDDGDFFAVGLEDGTIAYFNLRLGQWRQYLYPGAAITAIGWSHDNMFILWGDSYGRVRVLNLHNLTLTTDYRFTKASITSLKVNPKYNIVAFSTENTTFLATFDNGVLTVYSQLPYGTLGNLEWSPDGERLVIPEDTSAIIVDKNGELKDTIFMANIYPYRRVSWDPTSYSRIAFAGYNAVYRKGGLEILYSGAHVEITSSYPVVNICYNASCGSMITFSPWEQYPTVKFQVEAEVPGQGMQNVTVNVTMHLMPFTKVYYKAFDVLTNESLNKSVSGGKSLIILLHDPRTRVTIVNGTTEVNISANAVLLAPGVYKFRISYAKPANYLGPDSLLWREILVQAVPGKVLVYDESDFKIEKLTSNIEINTVPGSTLKLIYNETTVTTTIESKTTTYVVPAGTLKIILSLPVDGVLIGDENLLTKTYEVVMYPGDTLRISYSYEDVLGKITIRGPVGAELIIIPPWSTPFHPVKYNLTLTSEATDLWAYPGIYIVKATIRVPENYLGPEIPTITFNVTVEKGVTTWVDVYSQGNISDVISLFQRSSYVTIETKPGYIIAIHYDNKTFKYNMTTGKIRLVMPPGNYTIDLIDPSKNVIVNTKQLNIVGPGNITFSIQPILSTTTTTTTTTTTPPPEEGFDYKKLAVLIAIPVIVGIAAFLILRMKTKLSPL
ncbi:MAG: WD40 repeat domain-containing protein [Desulfurococcales archaeon]|nr:WD40 repeat domain-containing protein [Desulfurococcales archaeon]